MRAQTSDVTAALLIWLSDGTRPRSGDFRVNPSVEVFPSFAQAVEHAMVDGYRHAGQLPWIEVGSRVFDPDQVRSARSTVKGLEGRSPYTP
jgi:hypothetical protein